MYIWRRPCLLKCERGYVNIWQRPCVYTSVTEVIDEFIAASKHNIIYTGEF